MSGVLQRTLAIFELLSKHPAGLSVSEISARLDIPPSATHRLLNELARYGYVRQSRDHGDYSLTIKLAMVGLTYLGQSGVIENAQPVLDQLAEEAKELVRLSIVDGNDLVWVARAQGAHFGLRYDPDYEQSVVAHLATTASGQAWLMTMSDEEALMRVAAQGFTPPTHTPGRNAPVTAKALLAQLARARERGFSMVVDSYLDGMAAMAAPVRHPVSGEVIAVVSIAGPSIRMTTDKMLSLGRHLLDAADLLSAATGTSRLLARAAGGG